MINVRFVVLPLCVFIAACNAPTTSKRPAAPADSVSRSPVTHAQIGAFGLDLTARKSGVKPGDDFYAYANGAWVDSFTIPPDKSSYGSVTALNDLSEQRLRDIIENASKTTAPPGSNQQKVGDYYASFMDQAAIDAKVLAPIAAGLARIAAAQSRIDIAALFGSPGFTSAFGVGIGADLKNPDRYALNIGQAGLGLPDRDYYLSADPKLKDIRRKYAEHIERMLTMAKIADAHGKAQQILAFEAALARVHWSIEQRRVVEANYNPRSKSALMAYAPGFAWQAFFDASEIGDRSNFIVNELTAIRDSAKLFDKTPIPVLKAYLTYHYIEDHASVLPRVLDAENFAFYGTVLFGTPQQRARWKRGVQAVSGALGDAVDQLYVAQYFPPESKAKMEALVANLRVALGERIDGLNWMTSETKKRAHEKLATFTAKIGYPNKWKDYSALNVVRGDAFGNAERALLWEWHRELARIDKPVDRDEWGMQASTINAYYNPLNNEIVFPAAILQPPFFDPQADDAVNYGGIGTVIGHEMSHGFDDQGRKFGPDGSLSDWWKPQDASAFTDRAKRLIAEYSSFEALPGLFVKGQNTIGENIGDLGGLNVALHAYHHSLQGKEAPTLDALTGDQRFFLAFAQVWRSKTREDALRNLVMSDVHSPDYFRVNGELPNMDAWYAAFDVRPGEKLYIRPEDRVAIW
jgi:predicted metalloendopeptidase